MAASCTRCGSTMYLRSPSPTISCASCALSHSTERVFGSGRAGEEGEEEEDGAKTIQTTSSNAASFLYKFNVEPRNPDGTKIGNERHDDDVEKARATVDEPCPKCKHRVLRFYTMQLRSADEGQTVFYECEKCKHTFSQIKICTTRDLASERRSSERERENVSASKGRVIQHVLVLAPA